MRAPALLLPLLVVLLACKSDPSEDTGGSSTGDMCSDDVIGDADPNYPPCTCDFKCEDPGAMCRFTDMSSICKPQCVDDSDCPPLVGLEATCKNESCSVFCSETMPCPAGYVCIDNISCQAMR